jgi:glucosyl-3-phosphoglycerate phosphatase
MDRLILVRHGETAWNAGKVLQGQSDIELSERGREQARSLISVVHKWQPNHVVTSDLRRARQTASLIGYPDAMVDARWREADLGEWTSKSVVDLMAADAVQYQRWRDGVCAPPSGESIPNFRARVASAIEAVKPRKGNVLVVTHGGVIRAVLLQMIGLGAERIVGVEPGSITVLNCEKSPRLVSYNHTAFELETQTTD